LGGKIISWEGAALAEVITEAMSLTIQGEDMDNAATFTSASLVSARRQQEFKAVQISGHLTSLRLGKRLSVDPVGPVATRW
jgi:hypothetical protein